MPLETLKKFEKSVQAAAWRSLRCERLTTFAGSGPQGGHARDKKQETRNKKQETGNRLV